jgi:hypothetical protein
VSICLPVPRGALAQACEDMEPLNLALGIKRRWWEGEGGLPVPPIWHWSVHVSGSKRVGTAKLAAKALFGSASQKGQFVWYHHACQRNRNHAC